MPGAEGPTLVIGEAVEQLGGLTRPAQRLGDTRVLGPEDEELPALAPLDALEERQQLVEELPRFLHPVQLLQAEGHVPPDQE